MAENASANERKLKEYLENGSMFDRTDAAPSMSYQKQSFQDKMLMKQRDVSIEKLQEMLNIELYGHNILVEPSQSTNVTSSGLEIIIPANKKDMGPIIDISTSYQRVILVGKEVPKEIKPGDRVMLGGSPGVAYRMNGVLVEECRSNNIVAKIKNEEKQKVLDWWVFGKIDKVIPEFVMLKSIPNPEEGMVVQVMEPKAKHVFTKGKWKVQPKRGF